MTDEIAPKISVIIPAFNVEQYILRAVESSLGQTYGKVEVVVVDDGSVDSTWDILQRYADHPSVVLIHTRNRGVSSARNTAIGRASGDFYLFLDADDWLETSACERLLEIHRENPGYLASADCYFCHFSSDGELVRNQQGRDSLEERLSFEEAVCDLSSYGPHHVSSSCYKLFEKSIIDRAKLRFDESIFFSEDGLFVLSYLSHCKGLAYCPLALWNILERPNSATTGSFNSRWMTSIVAIEKMIELATGNMNATKALEAYRVRNALVLMMAGLRENTISAPEIAEVRAIIADYDKLENNLTVVEKVKACVFAKAPLPISRLLVSFLIFTKTLRGALDIAIVRGV